MLNEKEAVALVKQNQVEELRDQAVKEYAKVLKISYDEIRRMPLEVDKDTSTASTESRTIYYNPSPNSDLGFSGDYLLAEAIHEEVFHILTNHETIQESHGRSRKEVNNGIFWDFCAQEIFGGFSRLVDEKWELERSFDKFRRDLIEAEDLKPYRKIRSAIYHYIGYKLAAKSGRENAIGTVRELSRMSNEELKSNFTNSIEEIREFLALPDREFGYFIDINEGHYSGKEGVPVIFFQFQSELYYGKPFKNKGGWKEYEGELPEEAKPKAMR